MLMLATTTHEEIKNNIVDAVSEAETYTINLVLYANEGIIYNMVMVHSQNNQLLYGTEYGDGDIFDTPDSIEYFKREQKEMAGYLGQYLDHIIIKDLT